MVPIDSVGKAMEIIRRRMSEGMDASGRANRAATAAEGTLAAPRRKTLAETARRRIRAIDRADEQYHRKATRAFVESALLAEFGESLAGDPAFRELMHEVADTMLADAALDTDLKALLQELRAD